MRSDEMQAKGARTEVSARGYGCHMADGVLYCDCIRPCHTTIEHDRVYVHVPSYRRMSGMVVFVVE